MLGYYLPPMRSLIAVVSPVLLTSLLAAQDAPSGASARAAKLLEGLRAAKSFHFAASTKSPAARRSNPQQMTGTCEGPLMLWQREQGRIASKSGIWAMSGTAGQWTPARRPLGAWQAAYLPDPRFLAERLLALKDAQWKLIAENIDDKLVRTYRLELGKAQLRELLNCGALTKSGATNSFVVVGRAGARLTAIDEAGYGTGAIRVYEDPKNRGTIGKIVADLFLENANPRGAVLVGLPGGGVLRGKVVPQKAEPDDDDKKKTKKAKKPSLQTEILISQLGTATADIPDAARKVLEPAPRRGGDK